MPSGLSKRTRFQRVASLELPPGPVDRIISSCQRADVLWRIAICFAAAVVMWGVMRGWAPPFAYWRDYTPPRDIMAKTPFGRIDSAATEKARKKAADLAQYVYEQDPSKVRQIRDALKNAVAEIGSAANVAALGEGVWASFSPPPMPNVELPSADEQQQEFQKFHSLVDSKEKRTAFEKRIDLAFSELEQKGILEKLDQDADEGNQTMISVHPIGDTAFPLVVPVPEVRAAEATAQLHNRLKSELSSPDIAQRVFYWVQPKLAKVIPTLKKDVESTKRNKEDAEKKVKDVLTSFIPGDRDREHSLLAPGGQPLDPNSLALLHDEYVAELAALKPAQMLSRSLAIFGMFAALYLMCGYYVSAKHPHLLESFRTFAALIGLCVATLTLCRMASGDRLDADWRAELIPMLLFAMTVAIAYNQELALLLSAALSLVVVIALGQGLPAYVTLLSASAAAIFLLGRIRSRTKLIYVGISSAAIAMLTFVGVSVLDNQPFGPVLLREAGRVGLCALGAGFLMTGLLPFIEKTFRVLTDISLLEIGDPAHPLLQELVRRAPGTYNHSINVASIAEAAAESIGAHSLLVRVGAYFHDIGKMLKPQYFVENSSFGANRHEALLPAMSTLIIIAHIKDGADLGRQHHLPQPIVDFIQQHHGTTLVEYFFRRASEQSEANPDAAEVDESSYRYPGPKPQTKEAAVLMVADAVESASRALVEPTPARIEGLVHEISMKRLLDDQFDECGLTLQELQMIEDSLVKSLTAVYHGRVKYPDQRTA